MSALDAANHGLVQELALKQEEIVRLSNAGTALTARYAEKVDLVKRLERKVASMEEHIETLNGELRLDQAFILEISSEYDAFKLNCKTNHTGSNGRSRIVASTPTSNRDKTAEEDMGQQQNDTIIFQLNRKIEKIQQDFKETLLEKDTLLQSNTHLQEDNDRLQTEVVTIDKLRKSLSSNVEELNETIEGLKAEKLALKEKLKKSMLSSSSISATSIDNYKNELSITKQANISLKKEMNNVEATLKESHRALDSSNKKITNLEQELQRSNEQLLAIGRQTKEKELEGKSNEMATSQLLMDEKNVSSGLRNDIVELNKEIERLQYELDQSEACRFSNKKTLGELSRLESELLDMRSILHQQQTESHQMNIESKEVKALNEQITRDNEAYVIKTAKLEAELEYAKNQVNSLTSELSEYVENAKNREAEVVRMQAEVEDMSSLLEGTKRMQAELESINQHLESDVAFERSNHLLSEEKAKKMEKDKTEVESRIATMSEELCALRAQFEKSSMELQQLASSKEEYENILYTKEKELEDARQSIDHLTPLKAKLFDSETARIELQNHRVYTTEEIANLEDEVSRLNDIVSSTSIQLNHSVVSKEELHKKYLALESDVETLSDANMKYKVEISSLQKEKEQWSKEIKECQLQLNSLSQYRETSQEEAFRYKDKINSLEMSIRRDEDELDKARDTIDRLNSQVSTLQIEIEVKNNDIVIGKDEIEKLKCQMTEKDNLVSELKATVESTTKSSLHIHAQLDKSEYLRSHFESQLKNATDCSAQKEQTIQTLRTEINQLGINKAYTDANMENLNEKYNALVAEMGNTDVNKLTCAIEETQKLLMYHENALLKEKERCSKLEESNVGAQTRLSDSQKSCDMLKSKCEQLMESVNVYHAECAHANEKLSKSEDEKQQLVKVMDELQSQCDELSSNIHKVEMLLASTKDENVRLSMENQSLSSSVERLTSECQTITALFEQNKRVLATKDTSLKEISGHIELMQSQNAELQTEIALSRSSNNQETEQCHALDALREAKEKLSTDLRSCQEELHIKKLRMEENATEINALRQSMSKISAELDRVRADNVTNANMGTYEAQKFKDLLEESLRGKNICSYFIAIKDHDTHNCHFLVTSSYRSHCIILFYIILFYILLYYVQSNMQRLLSRRSLMIS